MWAAVYDQTGGPEVLRYAEVPDPELRSNGVLVAVEAVGIQGGDTLNRQGGLMASTPHIVGYQAAGTVVAVGADCGEFEEGQKVVATMGYGSHASMVSVPAGACYAVPDGLDIEHAAGIPIEFGTADDCLFEFGDLASGETVLIQAGASGVGIAAIQLAKAAGATVLATASSDERLARLHDYGLDHAINYRTTKVSDAVREITDGRGVDLIVDSGGGATLEDGIEALAYRGRISWVGRAGRADSPADVWPIMQKNGRLTGVFLGAEMAMNPARTRPMIESLIARCGSGELSVIIDRVFPLSEAADAHAYIESRRAFGRVILRP